MDIGEVVEQSGVSASALRYYEAQGLIRSVGRAGARRQFAPDVLDRLSLLALGQMAGLSLEEIAAMLPLDAPPRVDRELLSRRADELDHRIRQLTAMRNGLRHAAVCRAPDHLQCPTFRRLVRVAMRGRGGTRRRRG